MKRFTIGLLSSLIVLTGYSAFGQSLEAEEGIQDVTEAVPDMPIKVTLYSGFWPHVVHCMRSEIQIMPGGVGVMINGEEKIMFFGNFSVEPEKPAKG
jgi:hypothetical protein